MHTAYSSNLKMEKHDAGRLTNIQKGYSVGGHRHQGWRPLLLACDASRRLATPLKPPEHLVSRCPHRGGDRWGQEHRSKA